ncbi:upstream stimulatory factor 2-like isoform X1 [Leptopilina heterotoma]|uniref:upstream stimulatory factor 2-like isoform X1 n=1 Tax=Leptopilina heterotoma TaxID=63436 RepID=UPI001CA827F5|nr:upstream stimulatory factor 2-like isoform X1 [Leptopilina heterotoma]XP_043471024.1 upstream stimulatory factor 2-like isoform X1 [Leptopilina heterotoma]XP_043471089.1 upstream stimulatory factor 2-like isoform X1 [Leptopilina heterotoma]
MDITNASLEIVSESFEENSEENVSVILDESQFIKCNDDDETNEDLQEYGTGIYTSGEIVDMEEEKELLQIDGSDPNRPIEVMVPNSILHPYQVMHSPYDGKIYVITDNDDTYTTQTIRINSSEEPISKKRDDKRRTTHNEVERRRRDKINTWITMLGKLLPKYKNNDVGDSKNNFESQSKGGILSRACDYIRELKETNKTLDRRVVENKHLLQEVQNLRQLIAQLKKENSYLKSKISEIDDKTGT